jgi:lipopolysaccharide transport system permease protein
MTADLNEPLAPDGKSRPANLRRTVILAGAGGASWSETWRSRELLRVMVWRDFTLRYKQTFVGAGWAVLQPLGLTFVFAVFLGRLVPLPVQGLHYAVFLLPAMVLWQFFSKSLQVGGVSLSTNYDTVTKVFFPRIYLPVTSILGCLVDLGFALAATALVMLFYRSGPGAAIVTAPLFIAMAIVAAVGFAVWFAAFDARFRDLRLALPFMIQLWFFATPIVYSITTIPYRWRWAYHLNPMAGAVEGFRWSVLADVPRPAIGGLVLSASVGLVVMLTGVHYFRRAEGAIVDIL